MEETKVAEVVETVPVETTPVEVKEEVVETPTETVEVLPVETPVIE